MQSIRMSLPVDRFGPRLTFVIAAHREQLSKINRVFKGATASTSLECMRSFRLNLERDTIPLRN